MKARVVIFISTNSGNSNGRAVQTIISLETVLSSNQDYLLGLSSALWSRCWIFHKTKLTVKTPLSAFYYFSAKKTLKALNHSAREQGIQPICHSDLMEDHLSFADLI